ncbi:IS200/IS605 family transposase [Terriglobus sp. TAA 43]|uniref:IS200/IS605 family transposase n=1 Tax=Terriglobus sp. TAA 43 TaxID=278961 RepID=UPI000648ADD8|nr:IS200/IS605 family transposase [Terriglobus sp. TAA 43]
MPQSLVFALVHIIFSTKDRTPSITNPTDLHAYLATVARNLGCDCFRVGGTMDHVHLAVGLSRTITIADLISELKTSSSQWMKTQGASTFAWQRGYGAFTLGKSDLDALMRYIDNQEEHHRKIDFRDELRAILKRYGVEHDEQYVWD